MLTQIESMCNGHLDLIKAVKRRIELDTTGSRPIHSVSYRAGPKARESDKKEIDRMLGMEVIEPDQTEWALPVLLIRKKEDTLGFSVDYLKPSAVTIRDSYLIPCMDECV